MQDAKVLSQRDIARLQNVIGRLVKIGDGLLGKNGHGEAPKPQKRKRRRRTSSETPSPAPRRRRSQTDAPPPSTE